MTPQQLANLVPLAAAKGRPRSESTKILTSVRYSPEVIAFFKSTGEGWQTRMDEVLKAYVREHSE
ncbi:BrnA antitoxin family protein [Massilia sp. PAMC28688]|uniref:BrnA antitoxin family protein n=1 Tax=Massilia sp. PAMC28688 TaxID=2861283 RepID=UPI001E430020|nr:BrnA antitoxin family protein [Massilia sp. PAMC28688]